MERRFWAILALTSLMVAMPSHLIAAAKTGDQNAIEKCLAAWGKHPFPGGNPPFRTLSASVKIMGVGKDVVDNESTNHPELVLVKPAVSVMAKTAFRLMNPNGWYCFKSNVTVMGVSAITAACNTHLASSHGGVAIGGSNQDTEGVTVFGKAKLTREGCAAQ